MVNAYNATNFRTFVSEYIPYLAPRSTVLSLVGAATTLYEWLRLREPIDAELQNLELDPTDLSLAFFGAQGSVEGTDYFLKRDVKSLKSTADFLVITAINHYYLWSIIFSHARLAGISVLEATSSENIFPLPKAANEMAVKDFMLMKDNPDRLSRIDRFYEIKTLVEQEYLDAKSVITGCSSLKNCLESELGFRGIYEDAIFKNICIAYYDLLSFAGFYDGFNAYQQRNAAEESHLVQQAIKSTGAHTRANGAMIRLNAKNLIDTMEFLALTWRFGNGLLHEQKMYIDEGCPFDSDSLEKWAQIGSPLDSYVDTREAVFKISDATKAALGTWGA